MNTLQLRTATPVDVDEIVALVTRAYRGKGEQAGWTTEAHLLDGLRSDSTHVLEAMDEPVSRILLAMDAAGHMVGCIRLDRVEPDGAHFGLFAVDPTRQSSGAGTFLLEAVERQAREWGCAWLGMEVLNVRADIKAWYLRKGFRPTGESIPFPYGDERFGTPLRGDLVLDLYRKEL